MTDPVVPICPSLYFRGTRNYVHSTTLYKVIIEEIYPIISGDVVRKLQLEFKKVLKGHANFEIRRGRGAKEDFPRTAALQFKLESTSGCYFGWAEGNGNPIIERIPYDEQPIIDNSYVCDRTIFLKHAIGYEPIEVILSMAVNLHEQALTRANHMKWLLSRVELDRLPDKANLTGLHIRLERVIGNKYTRCGILAQTTGRLGEVHFMLSSQAG